jgi:taurine dioxygenase
MAMQGSLSGNKGPRYRHTADDSAPYETISVDKLTPIIGAEIDGIDLSKSLSNRQQVELHRAMWDYWPHTRSGNRVTVAGDKPY